MLEYSLFESADQPKTRTPATLISSVIVHGVIIALLVLIPLLHIDAVPVPRIETSLMNPTLQPEKVVELVAAKPFAQPRVQVDPEAVIAPLSIPREVAYVIDPPSPSSDYISSSPMGGVGSVLRGMTFREPEYIPNLPSPPPPTEKPSMPLLESEPIRRGGTVQQANLIHQVLPSYPPLARQTGIRGVVVLEAVISKEGTIESLRVVSGHPLFNQAAIDAVKQWLYKPTLLNGEPVAVITTITVSFSMR